MNVNPALDKYLVIYYSMGGNTKRLAELIQEKVKSLGQCELIALESNQTNIDIEQYSHVFIGSPTYGIGKSPESVRNFLRYMLKDNEFNLPSFSVFGTGDSQWGRTYCRSVIEMEHHISQKTKVLETLKIEQYPISNKQLDKINEFVDKSLRRS